MQVRPLDSSQEADVRSDEGERHRRAAYVSALTWVSAAEISKMIVLLYQKENELSLLKCVSLLA